MLAVVGSGEDIRFRASSAHGVMRMRNQEHDPYLNCMRRGHKLRQDLP